MVAKIKGINQSICGAKDGQSAATGMAVNMYDEWLDQEKITQQESGLAGVPRSNGFSSLGRG